MKKMAFLPQLAAYLEKHRRIYTVRRYPMARAVVEVVGIGRCLRVPLITVKSKEDLLPYADNSGFLTLDAWWSKILAFVPSDGSKYLYKVEVLNE